MKERPILMTTESVKAILDGRKTMTRRVCKQANDWQQHYDHSWVKFNPRYNWWEFKGRSRISDCIETFVLKCPYGQVGDRLWVRETWGYGVGELPMIVYKADEFDEDTLPEDRPLYAQVKWKPSIHMFREDSRLTLEITEVRVERLQEITEEDALAEGIKIMQGTWQAMGRDNKTGRPILVGEPQPYTARYHFEALWDNLNLGRGYGWETNPWVWVIKFDNIGVRVK